MSEEGMDDGVSAPGKLHETGLIAVDDHVFWTTHEIDRLIECWSQNADSVNLSRNEKAMSDIALYIGTNKTAKQVRAKLKKMRCRYIQEKEKVDDGKCTSKWRFYYKLNKFGHKIIKNPNVDCEKLADILQRKSRDRIFSDFGERHPRALMQTAKETAVGGTYTIPQVATIGSMTELPPIYPYDPDVPADVAVDQVWANWNATLPYAMTDSGLRNLMRCGFRDVSHLELLKRKNANISMLNLNYHDKLALEHALESDTSRSQQYQVITNDDGTVIEVRGCTDSEEAFMLTADGIKLATWNKALPFPLTDQGLVKVMKAGFTTPNDIMTLITDDEVEDIELTIRDKAALRKIVQDALAQREMA